MLVLPSSVRVLRRAMNLERWRQADQIGAPRVITDQAGRLSDGHLRRLKLGRGDSERSDIGFAGVTPIPRRG